MIVWCSREWWAEGVGMLACDLPEGHADEHQATHEDRAYRAIDAADICRA